MPDPSHDLNRVQRGLRGLWQGALFGAALGLARGVIKLVRGVEDAWLQLGGSILAGAIGAAIICGIGRAISGKVAGAVIGAVIGLFAGLFIGHAIFGYYWVTEESVEAENTTSFTMIGIPLGQMIGSAMGFIIGAAIGAFAEKLVRTRLRRS